VKKLLILGASNLQVPLITKAKSLGYKTIVLDMDKNAPGALIADVFVPTSTLDEEAVLKLASDEKITGIVTTSDMPVRVVAYVAMQPVVEGIKSSLGGKVPFLGVFTYGEQGCFFEENNFHGNLMISVTVFLKEHN
jgi:hypothetical protein